MAWCLTTVPLPLATALVCPLQRAELDRALVAAELNVVATDSGNTLMPALCQQPVSLAVVGQVCSQLRAVQCKTWRPCSWLRHRQWNSFSVQGLAHRCRAAPPGLVAQTPGSSPPRCLASPQFIARAQGPGQTRSCHTASVPPPRGPLFVTMAVGYGWAA